MVMMVSRERLAECRAILSRPGQIPRLIGEIIEGSGEVVYQGAL